jgi:S1-C subfamily serine protease
MMITSVEQGSAQTAGIRQGDVILERNDHPTNSVADLQAAITIAPGAVLRCKIWSITGSQDGKPVFAEKIVSMKTAPP